MIRDPFFGGVIYYNADTNQVSKACYPVYETETSSFANGLAEVVLDELGLWLDYQPQTKTKD